MAPRELTLEDRRERLRASMPRFSYRDAASIRGLSGTRALIAALEAIFVDGWKAHEAVVGGENQPHLDTSDEAIQRGAKALYEAQGRPHGAYELDVPRKGLRTYRAFEWEELAEIEKIGPRCQARLVIEAARRSGS